jgi:hypothetical protein
MKKTPGVDVLTRFGGDNITDEELRKSMTGVWERRRQLRLAGQTSHGETTGGQAVGQ